MNHEQYVYQGTIGYFFRITNANKYLVKVGLRGLEPPKIQSPPSGFKTLLKA